MAALLLALVAVCPAILLPACGLPYYAVSRHNSQIMQSAGTTARCPFALHRKTLMHT
jgi:hypothetical protein